MHKNLKESTVSPRKNTGFEGAQKGASAPFLVLGDRLSSVSLVTGDLSNYLTIYKIKLFKYVDIGKRMP